MSNLDGICRESIDKLRFTVRILDSSIRLAKYFDIHS